MTTCDVQWPLTQSTITGADNVYSFAYTSISIHTLWLYGFLVVYGCSSHYKWRYDTNWLSGLNKHYIVMWQDREWSSWEMLCQTDEGKKKYTKTINLWY